MKYEAKAIGSGSEGAQTNLQDQYNKVSDTCCATAARAAHHTSG